MWPYVLLIMLPITLQHISIGKATLSAAEAKRKSDFSMKLFWALLLTLLILRHETIGIDLITYKRIYSFIANNSWAAALGRSPEVAYSFINKVLSLFTENFRWSLAISAVLGTFFVARAYVKYSKDAALTIALFSIMSNFILLFSGLRQCIAISLGFLAFEFTRKKKLIPFLIVVFVAIFFHTSAFMIAFMYPLYHIRMKKKWIIFIVPMLGMLLVFNQQVFSFLAFILNMFSDYDTQIKLTGSYVMLILFVLFAVFAYLIPDESKLDSDTLGMRNFMLFSVALQMFAPLHNLAMRMNYYYIIFIPLLIPRIIESRNQQWRQVAVVARYVMIVFFVIYFFVTAPDDNALHTFPYHFFWENV